MTAPSLSLRILLAGGLGMLGVAAALLATMVIGHETNRRLEASVLRELHGRAELSAQMLARELEGGWRGLRLAAALPEMRDADIPVERRRRLLEAIRSAVPGYARLAFVGVDGTVETDADAGAWPPTLLADHPARNLHRPMLVASPAPASVGLSALAGPATTAPPVVSLALPVEGGAGQPVGMLVVLLDGQRAAQLVGMAGAADTDALIVTTAGRVLHGPPRWIGHTLPVPSNGAGPLRLAQANGGGLAVAAPTVMQGEWPGPDWLVVARRDPAALLAPVQRVQTRVLTVGLIAALIAAGIGWLAAWRLAQPLQRLAASAAALRQDPQATTLPRSASYTEADDLTKAMRAVLGRWRRSESNLRRREAELREAKEGLERRVIERTAELQAQQEQLRHIYDHTPAAFHSVGADGRIQSVSHYWLDFLGYRRDEVLGRDLASFMPAERVARWHAVVAAAGDDHAHAMELRLRRRDGSFVEVLMLSNPERDAAGRVVRRHGALLDLTERNRAEARLREAQKLEALGRIAGGVAHDFNNLLQGMIGALHLIEARPDDSARVRRYSRAALRASDRGSALTRRLLAFARQDHLRPGAVALADVLTSLRALLPSALGPRIAVGIDVAPDLPEAWADREQLELALFNLALNARDAMPEGGQLRIAATLAPAAGEEGAPPVALAPGRFLRVIVADAGAGMDRHTLARATEPFFTTKEEGQGSGLGLSMVHGFAAQSGGALAIDSAPGRGTAVTLWLPVAEPGVAAGQDQVPGGPPARVA